MVERKKIKSFEDLEVYQKLLELHLEVSKISLKFPKYELYELGSQIRRSSNSIPANLAEGWNNKHINIYLEGINRAFGEYQETLHHLQVAYRKGHIDKDAYLNYRQRYEESAKMLRGLESALMRWKAKKGER
ncbi:MAG: 23S rRNA-intervening sequence protein [Candidatus Argoarchaeum ethanivorans]|uniref:23S rRNA-intervening sequence protein n=1 Tax=Candidatus Argoarchaeum ethanivorans TaxID=2608793 RepID=A0A811TKB9_9EURY|nr:MAG: 23S rRNA-intervening sequence protein [Candidatus Argoarchaeum ethanivorans]CAD6494888.1 MAG: 23S rRNA-intervening sequence protein [Candidatus Argoarchaeum ethanivorans]